VDSAADPVVERARRQISDTDLTILEAVNRRIRLVSGLHRHKREQGYELRDPGREAELRDRLKRANGGPIGEERLDELITLLLDICRTEQP
jgi:chorismate mutase